MGSYPLARRGRIISIICLVLGGGMLLWELFGSTTREGRLLAYGAGSLLAGVYTQTMRLRVDDGACSVRAFGIGQEVKFSEITKMRLYSELLTKKNLMNLVITFVRDGRERKRTISNINQYDDYEGFIREVEMYSGKKVERI